MPVYLDCNATTPVEPAVRDVMLRYLDEEYGNSGSRTHEFGLRAKQAVQSARAKVAAVVECGVDEVVFTSGATESNNLAILGLAEAARDSDRRHVITTAIEHKAVLEPMEQLARGGFDVTLLRIDSSGRLDPEELRRNLRPDTVLVSVMHVNNETGVEQPISEIARVLEDSPAYLHVDAAQSFGKRVGNVLTDRRIDLISASAHKVYGPKGIGALIVRRRGFERVPLRPLFFGGGQERGLRPGTLPVHLVAGFGTACEMAAADAGKRDARCLAFRDSLLRGLGPLGLELNGDIAHTATNVVNASIPGLDSETFMLACKHLIAVSNGSACTSHSYSPSHVLSAMGFERDRIDRAVRFSWCHMTEEVDWDSVCEAVKGAW